MDSAERTTTMNISLPAVLRDFVAERVTGGAYSSASEYVRELIRADRQRQQGQARLEELLVEGIASGPAADWTDDDWTALRARVAGRVAEGPLLARDARRLSARIRRHPQALLDLEHTATWLGADDAAVALRVLDAVERTVRWLAAHPELGRARELRHAWLRGVRSFPVGGFEKHLVLYRPVADGIEVLRVRHGARDLLEEPDDSPER